MNSTEFKDLKRRVKEELVNRHNTFEVYNLHYVFHDDNQKFEDGTKKAVSIIFSSLEVYIKILMLYGLDEEKSRYTDSKELSYDLYHLTVKQKEDLLKIINDKVEKDVK